MFKNIILLGVIFVLIDSLYLYLMSNKFSNMIKNIQKSDLQLKLFPTLLCYLFLLSSLYYFIILKNGSLMDAFLLGFFIYGVYETTNSAIFKNYDYNIALIDTIWGGILFASSNYFYKIIIKKLFA
jgi:uncharacterized membrane protein